MGSSIDLPKSNSPTLALVHPTYEEKLTQLRLNGAEWCGALTLPAYIRREEVLSQQAVTKDGGITYWILVDTALNGNPLDASSTTRLPLASCETYRKRALAWQGGEVREVVCHGIGSVFCANDLRKRGYAQRMMRELAQILPTYQATEEKPSVFSVLYSDIGKKFYNNLGWRPFPSSDITIPGRISQKSPPTLPLAQPLYASDLPPLCDIDIAQIKHDLASRPHDSNTAVVLLPTLETMQWHYAREDFVGEALHGKKPAIKGAIVGTEVGRRVWCYWTRMWYNSDPAQCKGNTLHMLRLVMERDNARGASRNEDSIEAAIASLMALAQQEAEAWKMESVEIWNPARATVAAAQRRDPWAKVVEREMESITSLQWFPSRDDAVTEVIEWVGNEKYGWC